MPVPVSGDTWHVARGELSEYLATRGTWQLSGWAAASRASQTTSARNRPIGNITLDTKPIVLIAWPSERGVQDCRVNVAFAVYSLYR